MAISTMREFKKIYNPKMGRYMYQHYSGGAYYRSLRDINPNAYKGITGMGHTSKSKQTLNDHLATAEEQAIDVGDAIINRLKIRNNNGNDLFVVGQGAKKNDDVLDDVRARIKKILAN